MVTVMVNWKIQKLFSPHFQLFSLFQRFLLLGNCGEQLKFLRKMRGFGNNKFLEKKNSFGKVKTERTTTLVAADIWTILVRKWIILWLVLSETRCDVSLIVRVKLTAAMPTTLSILKSTTARRRTISSLSALVAFLKHFNSLDVITVITKLATKWGGQNNKKTMRKEPTPKTGSFRPAGEESSRKNGEIFTKEDLNSFLQDFSIFNRGVSQNNGPKIERKAQFSLLNDSFSVPGSRFIV